MHREIFLCVENMAISYCPLYTLRGLASLADSAARPLTGGETREESMGFRVRHTYTCINNPVIKILRLGGKRPKIEEVSQKLV